MINAVSSLSLVSHKVGINHSQHTIRSLTKYLLITSFRLPNCSIRRVKASGVHWLKRNETIYRLCVEMRDQAGSN